MVIVMHIDGDVAGGIGCGGDGGDDGGRGGGGGNKRQAYQPIANVIYA
jgi:hypothetical protein